MHKVDVEKAALSIADRESSLSRSPSDSNRLDGDDAALGVQRRFPTDPAAVSDLQKRAEFYFQSYP